jgi:hypothetical protein
MPKSAWDYYTLPSIAYGGWNNGGLYRVERTGRGKVKVERWQRKAYKSIDFDGISVTDTIENLRQLSEGLEDARVVNEIEQDAYGDGAWVTSNVSGWVDGVTEEEIAAVKKYLTDQVVRQQEFAERQREAAERDLERIKATFPDLIEGIKTES